MKIGIFMILWTAHVTEEHEPILEKLAETGYDGVEIPLFEGDVDEYEKLGKLLKKHGLGSTGVAVMPDEAHSPVSPDANNRGGAVEHLTRSLECAAALGADAVAGPLQQPLGAFTGEGPTEDEKKRAAEVHREAAEVAAKHNVMMCVEPINRFENYMITTMAQAAEAVQRVNHPNFTSMYDSFHANIEEQQPAESVRKHGNIIGHVHISENDRGIPGRGHIDFPELFRALHEINYDGWLTIEAFGRVNKEILAATRIWRDLYESPEALYTEGYQLIRDLWNKTG
jgi:D-psicose/D-tagatose/L-ribulose 3-epimerase